MKIVNIKKFMMSILLMLGLVIGILFLISNNSFSHEELTKKEIHIAQGDTLWTIARTQQEENPYYSQMDIREIIYEIKQLNHFDGSPNLKVGETLLIYGK